ncbi:transcription repressor NadR [Atopococcus tabaci]|uniref:transcription repressor NadR n=1 Tax=Atopococcus tabaci TaxID=269774 RepID=UPI000425F9B4|nr:transcription repressor NadR [Atopococcus tabaci]
MKASERRQNILRLLNHSTHPISAGNLAESFQVSRQAIVGDVALLRAEGNEILATPKGYVMVRPEPATGYVKQIVCQHDSEATKDELYTIVDLGGELADVIVEHPVYGELRGRLNVSNREDADRFLAQVNRYETALLSVLTNGIHMHTISTPDQETFTKITQALEAKHILYKD